jgi:exosortase
MTKANMTDKSRQFMASTPQVLAPAAFVLILFLPVLKDIVPTWLTEDEAGHCIFILPIAIALLWLRRSELKAARIDPKPIGLLPLSIGLGLEAFAYLMRVHFLEVWSFVPILAGFVYLVYGPEVWKIARFSIFLVVLLMPLPTPLFKPLSLWIRAASTVGATSLVDLLGYPVLRSGNVIQIPGMTVEVATVCSGFNKLAVLVTIALIYGYLYPINYLRRGLLLLLVVPIALAANIIRIDMILLASYYQGQEGFHIAHSYAEFVVIAASFALFVLVGNVMGCKNPRFAI